MALDNDENLGESSSSPWQDTKEEPRIESLVLDAGPLLTQSPLRGLAKTYYIPHTVVEELKDKRARDHLSWLQSEAGGCRVEIIQPGTAAMVAVTAFAKKTGDYSVLSRPDMNVLAVTYMLEFQRHGTWRIRDEIGGKTGQQKDTIAQQQAKKAEIGEKSTTTPPTSRPRREKAPKTKTEEMPVPVAGVDLNPTVGSSTGLESVASDNFAEKMQDLSVEEKRFGEAEAVVDIHGGLEEVEDDEDDEETGGEWITPENITKHKNRALGLVTDEALPPSATISSSSLSRRRTEITQADDGWSTVVTKRIGGNNEGRQGEPKPSSKPKQGKMTVACMTGDYAVQNVLLQMGLSLVGMEGQRIKQVKSWVLRCHACFKICKDFDKKFCPQCGNPTLMRTSVTSTAPDGSSKGGGLQVHLKKNFQYKNRGTIYSLPLPKPGKAGGAPHSAPILREDQAEWQKALNAEKVKRHKEERALQKALERGSDSLSARYEDADELSMLLAGGTGKNRTISTGLPEFGIGRKNPNDRRRRKV